MIWKQLARFGSIGFALWNFLLIAVIHGEFAGWRGIVSVLAGLSALLWFFAAWRWHQAHERSSLGFHKWLVTHSSIDLFALWRD